MQMSWKEYLDVLRYIMLRETMALEQILEVAAIVRESKHVD